MKRGGALVRAGALGTLLVCGACQTYRPLELSDVRRGARVRVVTTAVPVALREITVDRARRIDAEAVGVDNGNLVLSAIWVEREGGIGTPAEGWTVSVPVGSVSSLSERRVSWLRTAIVTGAIILGSALGWKAFGVGVNSEGGPGKGGEQL